MKLKLFSLTNIVFSFFVLLIPLRGFSQAAAHRGTIFERLTKKEADKITLEMDLTSMIENRKTDIYYPGMVS